MADKTETPAPDENIFSTGDDAKTGSEDISSFMSDFIGDEPGDDDEDDGGIDQPFDPAAESTLDVVDSEKGRDLLDKADLDLARGAKPAKKDDPKPKDAKPEDAAKDKPATDENAGKDTPDAKVSEGGDDLATAGIDALLDGVPDDRRAEISRRVGAADSILSRFDAHKDELSRHSQTPEGAIDRLLEINAYAQQKPDDYLAWVAKEVNPQEPTKILEGAAKRYGYKLVKENGEDSDDDLFEDERVKELREENARLKAAVQGDAPEFGPDTPDRVATRSAQYAIAQFSTAVDDAGQPKHPHFQVLAPRIAELAKAEVAQTGKAIAAGDLERLYGAALSEVQSALGVDTASSPDSAAQDAGDVAKQIQEKADAAAKAKRASKSVDGMGQGASRRPALARSASIGDTLRHFSGQGD